jgi:hypothetical protein
MALLTVTDAPLTGLANIPLTAAAVSGDEAPSGVGVILVIKNTDAATKTVTVTTPGTVSGLAIADISVVVPATTGIAIIPLIGRFVGSLAAITYSAVTGVTVGVVRVAR